MPHHEEEEELVLYHFLACPYCQRVRLTLEEKGLPYRGEVLDPEDDSRPEALCEINPSGGVPTVRHGQLGLYDSQLICEYLEERYPEPPLMAQGPVDRARTRLLFQIASSSLGQPLHELATGAADEEEEARQKVRLGLRRLAERLGDDDYFGGARFGMGDVAVASFYFKLCGPAGPAEDEAPGPLRRWAERLRQRESVEEVILPHTGMPD